MPEFDVMALITVGAYMIGDVMLSRGERTESEAWRRGGLLLIATAFGLLAGLAVEVMAG